MKFLAMMMIAVVTGACCASCSDDDDDAPVALNKFTISDASVSLTVGATKTLACQFYPAEVADQSVSWSSSDDAVATVSAEGLVTALKPGSASITAVPAANPELKQTCAVSVVANKITLPDDGRVEGTWSAYSTVIVDRQLYVPEGKSLTIEEGVQVIFNSNDANKTGIEFSVDGNIYCKGTAAAPILFSVADNDRKVENLNQTDKLWGGIMLRSSSASAEALFDNCVLEYAGSAMTETSPSVLAGIYSAGEDFGVQITTGPQFRGNLVVTNCIIRNGYADGIYMQGGNGLIVNNIFSCNGATGGEAVNVKAGTSTTVAYNVMYSPNTNGLKLSASGQDDAAGRFQSKCVAYNNTIVNAGWRRDGEKGGCIYVEKNILVNVFNNLMVNCKFRTQAPSWGNPGVKDGCDDKSVIDYNCYVSGSVTSDFTQDQKEGGIKAPWVGYTAANKNYYDGKGVDDHSVWAKAANDITLSFANFAYATNALSNMSFDDQWSFATTQMPSGAVDGATLYSLSNSAGSMDFVAKGFTVGGITYKADRPAQRFGI